MSSFPEESVGQPGEVGQGEESGGLNGSRGRERFQRASRVFKPAGASRSEVSALYAYGGGFQAQQYAGGWGESVQFEQRLSNAPATASVYWGASNGAFVPGYAQFEQPRMPVNGALAPPLAQASDSAALEEVAHLFTYRYYSLLSADPGLMYSLYAKDAQLSKPDLTGARVVASHHNEIRAFYHQFSSAQLTTRIHAVEFQLLSSQPLLLVLITGTYTLSRDKDPNSLRHTTTEETREFTQAVVLSGDVTRSRYHIVNDLLIHLHTNSNPVQHNNSVHHTQLGHSGEVLGDRVNKVEPSSHGEVVGDSVKLVDKIHTVNAVDSVSKGKVGSKVYGVKNSVEYGVGSSVEVEAKNKDLLKLAIFGIPAMVTENILSDVINQRLSQLSCEGKVVDVAIKPQKVNRKSNESLLYAFVELDSAQAVETLLSNDVKIQDRIITLEPYKRSLKKK